MSLCKSRRKSRMFNRFHAKFLSHKTSAFVKFQTTVVKNSKEHVKLLRSLSQYVINSQPPFIEILKKKRKENYDGCTCHSLFGIGRFSRKRDNPSSEMAGETAVSVLVHFKLSSVQVGEGDLRGDARVQMMKGVQLLHGSRGHAVTVAEDAGGRADVGRIAGAGWHRRPGTADVAAGVAAILPHQIPSPFRSRVLKPHLNNEKSKRDSNR